MYRFLLSSDIFKKSFNLSFQHNKKNVFHVKPHSIYKHTCLLLYIYKFFLSLSLSYIFFFRRRSIWHASINKSKAALLGFSDAHSERKRRKDIVRVNWGGDRDLLKIAFSVRKSLEWVSLIKQNFLG